MNSYSLLAQKAKTNTLLIDRDGTLFGTCKANFYAYSQSLAYLGIPVNSKMIEAFHEGKQWPNIALKYYPKLSANEVTQIHNIKLQNFNKIIKLVTINLDLAHILKNCNWAIVTNATKKSTIEILNSKELPTEPMAIYGSECGLPAKPSPLIYIHALEKLSLNPSKAIALEDSINGVASAKAAGIFVLRIPHFC